MFCRMFPYKTYRALALVVAEIVVMPLCAVATPNFTGTWKLNEIQRAPGKDAPRGIVFKIEHKESLFKYTATGLTSQGDPFTEALQFTTDGKPHPGPGSTQGSARWQGPVLVIEFTQADGAPLATVRYQLTAEGRQMIRETIIKIHGSEEPHREIYDRQ